MIHRTDHVDLDCAHAREALSARIDGELAEADALAAHLARCGGCRAHERSLAALARGFATLREPAPAAVADLWERIEARAAPRPSASLFARAAAALVGFVGLGGAVRLLELEGAPPPERHVLERLAPSAGGPDAIFAALPEYRLLRSLPAHEELR